MKLRRILSLLLVLAMVLSLFSMTVSASTISTKRVTRSRTNFTHFTDEQLMEMLGVSLETLHSLQADAYDAVMNNRDWDVSSYGFTGNNPNHEEALTHLAYEHPELFMVNGFGIGSYNNGTIAFLRPYYYDGYEVGMEQHKELEAAAQEVMCLFQRDESLSDLELALLVHDYLAANYEYHLPTLDLPQNQGKYSAYNLLVEGTAVCQGYAEAYAYLMMQFGINCGLCVSDTLNHAWNIIEIDGKEYHVDITWDDPTNDRSGYARHINFLRSTEGMIATGHEAEDFTGTPSNTEYDSVFWQDVKSAFCLLDGNIYYVSADQKLCTWNDGETKELLEIPGIWYADNGYYWPGSWSCLATDGDSLFYSSPTDIYKYDPETKTSEVFYTPELAEGYSIFGFNVKNNNFYIDPYNSPNFTDTTKAENQIVYAYRDADADSHVYDEGKYTVEPSCVAEGEILYTCTSCGVTKTETAPIDPEKHDWKDATCTEPKTCSLCGEKEEGVTGYIHQDSSAYTPQTGDQLVITVEQNSSYTAMPTVLVSGRLPGTDITVADGMITSEAPPVWTIEAVEGGYALKANGTYLHYSSGTTFKTADTPYAWKLTVVDGGYRLTASGSTSREIYYQNSGARFAPYATSNQSNSGYISVLQFFKYSSGGGAPGHKEETTDGYEATCTKDGLTDGKVCSVCGEVTQKQEVIPATGHAETIVPAVAATCTKDGLTEGKSCATCGEVILAQETVPATGHTEKQVDGSDATCTEDGMSAGIICETCGAVLGDQTVTPALGHAYIYTPNNDGTHTITCSRCDLSESAECTYEDGLCKYCHYEAPVADVVSYKLIDINNIKEGKYILGAIKAGSYPTIYPATANLSTGTNKDWYVSNTDVTAENDIITSDQLPEDAQILVLTGNNTDGFTIGIEVNGATQYLGYTTITTSRRLAFGNYSAIKWTIHADPEGGFYLKTVSGTNVYTIYQNATGTTPIRGYKGTTNYTGIYLFAEFAEETPCEHGNTTDIAATDATCTENGNTAGVICNDCGETISGNEVIPATGHSYNEGEVTTPATCTEDGVKTFTCICGDTYTEAIPAGHNYDVDGICSVCGAEDPCKDFSLTDTLNDGDQLVIYYPAGNTALANTITAANRVATSDVTVTENILTSAVDTAVFTVNYVDEINFTLQLADGTYLTSGATGNTLTYTEEASEFSQWYLVPVDSTALFKIMSTNAAFNGNKNQAIEYYNGFTVYGVKDTEIYQFRLYTIGGTVACIHEWNEGEVTTPADCINPGEKTLTCTLCSETKTEPIPAKGHSMNDGEVTTPATCTADGVKTYTCTVCNHTETETIPANGHSMNDGEATTPATCTEDGVMTYTCTVCGATETEVIPATGHTMGEDGICSSCGYTKPVVKAGKYVIAANVNGVYYAMSNTFAGKIGSTEITVTDGTVSADDADGYVITLTSDGEGWNISDGKGNYLKYSSSTNLASTTTAYAWTITEGTNGTWRVAAQTSGRGLVFRAKGYNQFGGYATSNCTAGSAEYYDIELIPVVYDVEFSYHSLSLKGNIAINYYINLSDRVVTTEGAYLRFTFADGDYEDILVADLPQTALRGVNYYQVSCELTAKEMADDIQAQVFYGEKQSAVDLYSITRYADNTLGTLKASEEKAEENKGLIDLVEKMLHYGAASQLQFQYNTDNLADAGLAPVDYSTITIGGYDIVKPQGTELVQFAGASLLLKSETTLRLFFRVDASIAQQLTISYAGEALTLNQRNGLYYVDVTDIVADKLDELVTVTINDGVEAEKDVSYYPLAYCVSVATNANGLYNEALINVVKALFLYNQAANTYFEEV